MKSLLPIDETWTAKTMGRVIGSTAAILQHNNLPDTGKNANPFGTILEQQKNVIKNIATGIHAFKDELSQEINHVNDIKASLSDDIKATALAAMNATEYSDFKVSGFMSGFLNVPSSEVDEVVPLDKSLQTQILQVEVDEDHPFDARQHIHHLMRSQLKKLEIPAKFTPNRQSEDNWYWKPRGEVMFQIEGAEPMEIPSWPDDINDRIGVSWSQEMTTFQHYEDQNTFKQSGPRTMDLLFKLHRAMWNGNQDSGDCETLVAYMESACYPDYDTQAAEPPRVLFTAGKSIRIYGIVTSFNAKYCGSIGPDVKYDRVEISLSIKEESQNVLSTQAVRSGLAGWR